MAPIDANAMLRTLVREVLHEVLAEERAQVAATEAPLLDVYEAAELANLKPATIRTWINAGRLPAMRAGRRFRVHRADVLAAMQPARPTTRGISPEDRAHRDVDRILKDRRQRRSSAR
jgi:excisionase family DNA binding protein